MVKIAFPGLGIDTFSIDPVAFSIPIFGGISVRWYGLIITIGIILAFLYCSYRAKQEGIVFDHLLDIAIFTIVFGIIGARTGYVLFSLKDHTYESFYDVIAIWNGGLQIYGAIIAGAITIIVVCLIKKLNPLKMLDATAPAVMIGQILGRWGNFCNGEAHGGIVSEGNPLYFLRMGLFPHDFKDVSDMAYVHPTFLYESVWNLIGFVIIHFLYKKKKFDGQIVLMYLAWYGFGRMFIEMLRTDSLMLGPIRISVLIGFICFVLGTALIVINLIRLGIKKSTNEEYTPAYPKLSRFTKAESKNQASDAVSVDTKNDDSTVADTSTSTTEDKDLLTKRFNEVFGEDNKEIKSNETEKNEDKE